MGLRIRLHWFDKGGIGVGRELSADLGNDNIVFQSIGLSVKDNVNNGLFSVEEHWAPLLQPLFYHWINLIDFDYQVAFDYRDTWSVNESSTKWSYMMTVQFISIDELVGIPLPYPLAEPPQGWFICQGQAFDKMKYPKLAHCYPTGKLPDLRGEFIRGWDNMRGVDNGRRLISEQNDAIRNITGTFNPGGNGVYADGVFSCERGGYGSNRGAASDSRLITFDASKKVPTAHENRPRNIAFNYIVRAA